MDSLYSSEVREYIHTRDWPVGLKWEVVEYYEPELHLQFVLYRSNINQIDASVMLQVASTCDETFANLRKKGVPIYLEVKP